jgi:CobQ-like glutamine amidotransferase family enzyme
VPEPAPTPSLVAPTGRVLRVCALYPDLMNIYADRGNLLVLEHRCSWRGIGFELSSSDLGEPLNPDAHDLYYLGGGQDRDQRLCAEDLIENKRSSLHAAAARDAVILGVCGGYQLLGHSYVLGQEALGRVLKGHGNDGRSGLEGALHGNTIGTYLHGPLLPKNAWFADWLIATSLHLDPSDLTPLDDTFERDAHLSARRAAGV